MRLLFNLIGMLLNFYSNNIVDFEEISSESRLPIGPNSPARRLAIKTRTSVSAGADATRSRFVISQVLSATRCRLKPTRNRSLEPAEARRARTLGSLCPGPGEASSLLRRPLGRLADVLRGFPDETVYLPDRKVSVTGPVPKDIGLPTAVVVA